MAKMIVYGEEARKKLQSGIDQQQDEDGMAEQVFLS